MRVRVRESHAEGAERMQSARKQVDGQERKCVLVRPCTLPPLSFRQMPQAPLGNCSEHPLLAVNPRRPT